MLSLVAVINISDIIQDDAGALFTQFVEEANNLPPFFQGHRIASRVMARIVDHCQ